MYVFFQLLFIHIVSTFVHSYCLFQLVTYILPLRFTLLFLSLYQFDSMAFIDFLKLFHHISMPLYLLIISTEVPNSQLLSFVISTSMYSINQSLLTFTLPSMYPHTSFLKFPLVIVCRQKKRGRRHTIPLKASSFVSYLWQIIYSHCDFSLPRRRWDLYYLHSISGNLK